MKKRTIWISLVAGIVAVAVSTAAWAEGPAVPQTPAAVEELLYARTFTLENGYTFDWSKERPLLTQGTILVLKVDPALVYARQTAEPVLYVGDRTAERVNIGHRSGHVVAIVPGHVDLTRAPIWFGSPELPERVDAATVRAERALADAAGIKPFGTDRVSKALTNGGARLGLTDRIALRPHFVSLLERYSAVETDLIETFNVPVNR